MIKKYLTVVAVVFVLCFFLASPALAVSRIYGFTSITGGASGALDAIDGVNLTDADMAYGISGTLFYTYKLSASSGAAESSPSIIAPNANAGTKRWILISTNSGSNTGDGTMDFAVGYVLISTVATSPTVAGTWVLFGTGRIVLDVDVAAAANSASTITVYLWRRTA